MILIVKRGKEKRKGSLGVIIVAFQYLVDELGMGFSKKIKIEKLFKWEEIWKVKEESVLKKQLWLRVINVSGEVK